MIPPEWDLSGKAALVTSGDRGRTTVLVGALAEAGASIAVVGSDPDERRAAVAAATRSRSAPPGPRPFTSHSTRRGLTVQAPARSRSQSGPSTAPVWPRKRTLQVLADRGTSVMSSDSMTPAS